MFTLDRGASASRRAFLGGLVGTCAASLLAACSSSAPAATPMTPTGQSSAAASPTGQTVATAKPSGTTPTPVSASAPSAGSVTVNILGLSGHPTWMATQAMAKTYKEKAPNVNLKLSELGFTEIIDKVNLNFQAKSAEYDIVWMNSVYTEGYWSQANIVIPLDDLVTPDYDVNDFLKSARSIGTMKGKLYGIAVMIEGRMLTYRKDVLDAAQLKPPTTLDEMMNVAKTLTNKDKQQFGFSMRNADSYGFMGWLYGFGGKIFDEAYKPQLASPEAKAALDAMFALDQYGTPSTNRAYGDIVKELQTGVAVMGEDVTIITPLLEDPKASANAGKFDYIVPPPGPKGPRPETSAHLFSISSQSKQRDPAWQFLEWMTSKENNKPWIFAGGAAYRESMYQDKEIIAKFPQYTLYKQILDQSNPDYVPRIKSSGEIMTNIQQQVSAAKTGVKPVDKALADANQQVETILRREGYLK